MPHVTESQLRTIRAWAVELDRLSQIEAQIGGPPARQLKQMDRALPDLSLRIKAMVVAIQGQDDEPEARF